MLKASFRNNSWNDGHVKDLESGEIKLLNSSATELQEKYTKNAEEQVAQIKQSMIRSGASWLELPTETSTTEEFFNKVQTNKALVKLDSQGLSEFMQSADRVKFARQDVSEVDLRRALEYAISFIRKNITF